MRLRTKLFIILILLSIGPLIMTGLLTRANLESCSVDVASDTRQSVEQIVEIARTRYVDLYATTFDRDRILIESTVRRTADTLEQIYLIDEIETDSLPTPDAVYFSTDYDNPETRPENMVTDPRQFVQLDDGSQRLFPISRQHPVFVRGEGDDDSINKDIRMLAALTPELIAGSASPSEKPWLLSVYASLEDSGTHISYPGKGGYPEDYDPRQRPWFEAAIGSETGLRWIGPIIDAPTGQVRMTCAAAAYRPDGTVIGVVAADMLMLDMLDEIDLPEDMAGAVNIMLATLDNKGVLIHAKSEYAQQGGKNNAPIQLEYLKADHQAQTDALINLMRAESHGSLDYVLDGRVWILSYQRLINQDSYVIVAIARETIDAIANNVQDEVADVFTDTLSSNAAIGATILGIAVAVSFFGARSVTRPIMNLTNTATAISEGDLDATADINTGDEIETLARTFNEMIPKLRDRLAVRESLMLAMEVQQNLLPSAPPTIQGVDIAARSIYCDETGGDYFDFFELEQIDPNKHAIVVGDVTGHGIAAALLMTTARALLRSRASDSDEIADVLSRVNRNLARDTRPGHFMTLYYLLIDPPAGTAAWVSAGHDAAIIYNPSDDSFSEYTGQDIPLGIEAEWQFNESSAKLPAAGGVLLIGTDGIWEARNGSGDMYGKDRLRELMKSHARDNSDQIAQAILDDVVQFREGTPQTDDITLVVLKVV
ncbi:MAG: HAMP domain-containing protein [Phycisphaera sp.]|nr:MAG: HAMP domain-containing protein [Phycisphaera sp.]